MNPNEQLLQLASRVSEIAIQNTASAIFSKIKTVKESKDDKSTISLLEEIINELLSDKNDLLRVIKVYEEEYVAQKLTDKDIEYIVQNVIPTLKELAKTMEQTAATEYLNSIEPIFSLLTPEMLKIIQLLGFNYKRGIGEPLTTKLKTVIESANEDNEDVELRRLICEREIELYKVLQNKEAYDRLKEIQNNNQN